MRPAVFLDRDGTIIELIPYLVDPQDVSLIQGAGSAIRRMREAGYACVVVTNQSVVGRGLISVEGLATVHARMREQLAGHGADVDGIYFCPVKPAQKDPTVIEDPDRKPGPGMLQRAARELGLSLERSWMVGDNLSDLLAGWNAGCQASVLVRTGNGRSTSLRGHQPDHVVENLAEAADLIIGSDKDAVGGRPPTSQRG